LIEPSVLPIRQLAANRVGDIMQWIGDDALWQKLSPAAIEDEIGRPQIKMVSYEDLVELKKQAGRSEDLADLKRLRQAREDPQSSLVLRTGLII
jgi:hypothetical protein